jgi:hypothetical protein
MVDPADFIAARPDPFHVDEKDLLVDLVSVEPGEAQVVRLARHGVVVRVGSRLVRVEFRQPANGPCCVARALRLGLAGSSDRHRTDS